MTTDTSLSRETLTSEVIKSGVSSHRMTVGALMLLVGAALIFAVGFAQGAGGFLHNAAHDTRHAVTFPCH